MKIDTIYFDITTSSQWSGHPVGIVRVERELAARAPDHLGTKLSYCVYDRSEGNFKELKNDLVPAILAGQLNVTLNGSPRGMASPATRGLRRQLRNMALEVPAAYMLIQRLRGHSFSKEDVRLMKQQLKPPSPASSQPEARISLSAATKSAIELNEHVAIVSGGLDWEHKELRTIYRLRQKTQFKFISIIYDLIPINLPHYVVPHYVNLLTEYFGELLWTTDGCLCISETTKRDFLSYCGDNGVIPPPTHSFPLGSDLNYSHEETEAIPDSLKNKNYILFVSTIEPRKNHRTAYDAWCHALMNGTIDPRHSRLVFVGRQGWLTGDLVHELSNNPLTRETVVRLSDVSDAQLTSLYRHAAFTILPSFYEGFGLPLAEALGHGKVCVTSGAGALSEIGDGFRIDVNPRDTLGWASTFAELLNNPDRLSKIEGDIRSHYTPIGWDQSSKFFFDSLKQITE